MATTTVRCFLVLFLALLEAYRAPTLACPSECYCRSKNVDCYGRDLQELPDGLSPSAVYVNLQNNQIPTIIPERLARLTKVEDLSLNDNKITSLQAGSVVNMTNLKTLNLGSNDISQIEPRAFQNLPQIQALMLGNNQLEDIEGVLGNLSSLERLILDSNKLTSITDTTFSDLSSLTYLSLSNNQISSISVNAFKIMTKLAHLILQQNPLKNVDKWNGLSALTFIDLSSCQLVAFPTGLPINLKSLKLNINSITSLRYKDLSQLRNLGDINLGDNEIVTTEDGVFNHAPYLSRIVLSGNKLRMLPRPIPANVTNFWADNNNIERLFQFNFDHDSSMSYLSLMNNSIEALAANTFSRLIKLSTLSLDYNNIQVMYQMAYSRLRQLRKLSLRSNPIREVEKRALGGLPRLTRLRLSDIPGKISGITEDLFREVPSLTSLDLQNSPHLTTAILNDSQVIRSLRSIKYLNLMNNNLTNLDVNMKIWMPKLRSINLMNNPWRCNADLIPLRNWMESSPRKFSSIRNVICQYPYFLQGKMVKDVPIDQFTITTTAQTTTMKTTTTTSLAKDSFITNEAKSTAQTSTNNGESISSSSNEKIFTKAETVPSPSVKTTLSTVISSMTDGFFTRTISSSKHVSIPKTASTAVPEKASTTLTKYPTTKVVLKSSSPPMKKRSTTSAIMQSTEEITNPSTDKTPPIVTSKSTETITYPSTDKTSSPITSKSTEIITNPSTDKTSSPITSNTTETITNPSTDKTSSPVTTKYVDTKPTPSSFSKCGCNKTDISSHQSSLDSSKNTKPGLSADTRTKDGNSSRPPPLGTAKSGESRLTAKSSSSDNTNAIVIGISTSLVCLVIALIVILLLIRGRERRKKMPLDQNDLPSSHQTLDSSDTTIIIKGNGSDVHSYSHSNKIQVNEVLSSNESGPATDSQSPTEGNKKKSRFHKISRFRMPCLSSQSQDDSEMLVYSWDDPNH